MKISEVSEIKNSETSGIFRLLQILIVSIALSVVKLKNFIEFQITKPHVY